MTFNSIDFADMELGACLELVIDHRGKTPRKLKSDWVESGIPTISAKNVNSGRLVAKDAIRYVTHDVYKKWMSVDVTRGDCFLVSEGATLGHCMYWDEDYPIVLGQRIFCLRVNPEILYNRYLYAYMNTLAFQSEIVGRATGSSVSGLRQTEVLKLNIKVPPMAAQKFIGDTLYNLNKKAEVNNHTNQTLEEMAQTIFKSWFVDFDPVKAKMNGEQPEGMDAATASLFPEKLVESELGLIPEGWEVSTLSSLIKLTGGGTPKRSEETYWNGDIPWFSVRDVPSGSNVFVVDTDEKITELGLNKSSTKLLPKGTTIITARGTVGKLALVGTDMCMNQSCYGIRGKEVGDFYNYFNLNEAVSTLQRNTHGAVFDTITTKTFDTYSMAFSGAELANKFDSLVAPLLQKIEANVRQNIELAMLRDTLLPKLLSGEIELETAKEQ
ncbi:restriction endonuclease subunit S [Vibrio sp. DNB22_19_2]